jgi:hypothetical protein
LRGPEFQNPLPSASRKFFQNRNVTVLKTAVKALRARGLETKMKDLVRYRAMESLCRQSAVFHPLESWRLLAEAEMWHHKALDQMASDALESAALESAALASDALKRDRSPPAPPLARTESVSIALDRSRLSAR